MSHLSLQAEAFGSNNTATKMDSTIPWSNMIIVNDSLAGYFLTTGACNQNNIKSALDMSYLQFSKDLNGGSSICLSTHAQRSKEAKYLKSNPSRPI